MHLKTNVLFLHLSLILLLSNLKSQWQPRAVCVRVACVRARAHTLLQRVNQRFCIPLITWKKKKINYINKATPQGFEQARFRQESRTRVGYGLLAEFFCLNDGCKSNGAPRLSVVNKCLFRKISWHTDFATHCARFCESNNAEKHDLLFLFCINWQGSIYSQDKIRSVQFQSCHKCYLAWIYQWIFTEVIFK